MQTLVFTMESHILAPQFHQLFMKIPPNFSADFHLFLLQILSALASVLAPKMGQKVIPNRSKIETTSPCCSQEAPRPSQGCPRDPQGLHLGAFWWPRAPPRVPKGPPRVPFCTSLGVLLPPWHHLGIHLEYFCYFWSNFGPL